MNVSYIVEKISSPEFLMTEEDGKWIHGVMESLSFSDRLDLWSRVMDQSVSLDITLAKFVHKHCVSLILEAVKILPIPVVVVGDGKKDS